MDQTGSCHDRHFFWPETNLRAASLTPFCGWILRTLTRSQNSPGAYFCDQDLLVSCAHACAFESVVLGVFRGTARHRTGRCSTNTCINTAVACIEQVCQDLFAHLDATSSLYELTLTQHPELNRCVYSGPLISSQRSESIQSLCVWRLCAQFSVSCINHSARSIYCFSPLFLETKRWQVWATCWFVF